MALESEDLGQQKVDASTETVFPTNEESLASPLDGTTHSSDLESVSNGSIEIGLHVLEELVNSKFKSEEMIAGLLAEAPPQSDSSSLSSDADPDGSERRNELSQTKSRDEDDSIKEPRSWKGYPMGIRLDEQTQTEWMSEDFSEDSDYYLDYDNGSLLRSMEDPLTEMTSSDMEEFEDESRGDKIEYQILVSSEVEPSANEGSAVADLVSLTYAEEEPLTDSKDTDEGGNASEDPELEEIVKQHEMLFRRSSSEERIMVQNGIIAASEAFQSSEIVATSEAFQSSEIVAASEAFQSSDGGRTHLEPRDPGQENVNVPEKGAPAEVNPTEKCQNIGSDDSELEKMIFSEVESVQDSSCCGSEGECLDEGILGGSEVCHSRGNAGEAKVVEEREHQTGARRKAVVSSRTAGEGKCAEQDSASCSEDGVPKPDYDGGMSQDKFKKEEDFTEIALTGKADGIAFRNTVLQHQLGGLPKPKATGMSPINCKSSVFEPTKSEDSKAETRPRNKFSKFFKSFKLKFAKKP